MASKFSDTMIREDMDIESSCTKTFVTETLTEEILTVALREFDYQEESFQFSLFGYFGSSGLRCRDSYALFSNQVPF